MRARSRAGAHDSCRFVMPLQLRDNIHWCDCANRAVFLDVEADRYFCLPAVANAAFLRLAAGQERPGDAGRLEMLVRRGVLVDDSGPAGLRAPAIIAPPARDWLPEPLTCASLLAVLRALASELSAARALRTRPLLEVLDAAKRRRSAKRRDRVATERMLRAIVRASTAASYFARVQDRCLVRALALHATCRRNGIAPKLVFGVIAHPFAAHCWVQLGDAVLVGGYEQARLYTPILVVE